MWQVGDHLGAFAQTKANPREKDLFGRSAFNRHYYAAYWAIRTNLHWLNWSDIGHAAIPDLLGGFKSKISRQKRNILKTGIMPIHQVHQISNRATAAINELVRLFNLSYATRVVADYEPDRSIDDVDGILSLNSVKFSVASHWHEQASKFSLILRDCLRQLGLVSTV
jgi:hypothetical protein